VTGANDERERVVDKGGAVNADFKGNKASLPSKPCQACGRTMSWRRAWAKNWAEVRYCSEACRRKKTGASHAAR
jgi:hypothetical protein